MSMNPPRVALAHLPPEKLRYKPLSDRVLWALMNYPDGLTIQGIAEAIGHKYPDHVRLAVQNTWGAYIDRWQGPIRGQWQAVYCLATVPENAPKPTKEGLRVTE